MLTKLLEGYKIVIMAKKMKEKTKLKQLIRAKSIEITENMSKLTDHLEIIKNMDSRDSEEIYIKDKHLLINLYEYYCKFQKLYSDLSFSEILNPLDVLTIKNINIKKFSNEIKKNHKNDYEITIEFLKEEDKICIKSIYEQMKNDVDELVNLLINIQTDIITKEISPIEQNEILEKINNRINSNSFLNDYKNIETNYLNYLDEYNASKEVFK
jgi:hypothetical protein